MYVWFLALVLPPVLGIEALVADVAGFDVSPAQVFEAIAIFLGLPFAAEIASRFVGTRATGETWYEEAFVPTIDPLTLAALLFTVAVMFATQGGGS